MTAPPAGALPPLPEPDFLSGNCNVGESAYTADQMREYALLAALRLREGCQRLEQRWRDRENFDCYVRSDEQFSGVLRGRGICADDLARVLEQTK